MTATVPRAISDLLARQSRPVRYSALMPIPRAKRFHTAAAAAALCGFSLVRQEDDCGLETFLATREAVTLHFRSLGQVDAWVDHLIELRTAGAACPEV